MTTETTNEATAPMVPDYISGSIVITQLEMALNRTPERRSALIEAKLANARECIRVEWERRDRQL
jgi:hypothetical protein